MIPLPGICGLHLGHKIGVRVQDVKDFDNLPALPLFLTGYVQQNVALYEFVQRVVNGLPVGARPGMVQKAAVTFNRGIS